MALTVLIFTKLTITQLLFMEIFCTFSSHKLEDMCNKHGQNVAHALNKV